MRKGCRAGGEIVVLGNATRKCPGPLIAQLDVATAMESNALIGMLLVSHNGNPSYLPGCVEEGVVGAVALSDYLKYGILMGKGSGEDYAGVALFIGVLGKGMGRRR